MSELMGGKPVANNSTNNNAIATTTTGLEAQSSQSSQTSHIDDLEDVASTESTIHDDDGNIVLDHNNYADDEASMHDFVRPLTFTGSMYHETKLLKLLEDAHAPNYLYKKITKWVQDAKLDGYSFNVQSKSRASLLKQLTSWQMDKYSQLLLVCWKCLDWMMFLFQSHVLILKLNCCPFLVIVKYLVLLQEAIWTLTHLTHFSHLAMKVKSYQMF
jgi:hypothetical protein